MKFSTLYGLFFLFRLSHAQSNDIFDDPVAVMRCVNGSVRLRKPEESSMYFKPIIEDCRKVPNGKLFIHAYWSCMLTQMGLAHEYKKPTMDTLGEFYCRMFSSEILDEIPTYKRQLRECAEDFVNNFNRIGDEKQYLVARLLNCSVRHLFAQLGVTVLKACSPSPLEMEMKKADREVFMHCENTTLMGKDLLSGFINASLDTNCSISESYNRAVVALGIIAKDGTPTLRKIRKWLDLIYPPAVLEEVPRFPSAVLHCGNTFVRSHMEGNSSASSMFIDCFWSQHDKFQPDFDAICGKTKTSE